MRIEISVINT